MRLWKKFLSAIVNGPAQQVEAGKKSSIHGQTHLTEQFVDREEQLFIAYRSWNSDKKGPVLATVASRQTSAMLDEAFNIIPIWPNDAHLISPACRPDLLLVESGAVMPGEVWTTFGTALGANRERALVRLIENFQRRSIPVLFWWTTPVHLTPDLRRMSRKCDAEVSDDSIPGAPEAFPLSVGVNLSKCNPVVPSDRPTEGNPLLHLSPYETNPRITPANSIVRAAVEAGATILYEPSHLHPRQQTLWPSDAGTHYRQATWTTPNSGAGCISHRSVAMLASGIPTLTSVAKSEYRGVMIKVSRRDDLQEAIVYARQRATTPNFMAKALRTVHKYGTDGRPSMWLTCLPRSQCLQHGESLQ